MKSSSLKPSRLLMTIALVIAGGAISDGATAGAGMGAGAGAMPCLSAIVRHLEHSEGGDGITRELSYRDRFQRCEGHVYIARIIPATAVKARRPQEAHEAPDLAGLPRRITRERDGRTTLSILDAEGRRIIDVDRGSFETVRFDPSFDRASMVFDKRSLAEMKKLDRASTVSGAHWFERSSATRFVRVLWDEERSIALAIESGSADGTVRDDVRVDIEGSAASPPPSWVAAKSFTHVDFADFGD